MKVQRWSAIANLAIGPFKDTSTVLWQIGCAPSYTQSAYFIRRASYLSVTASVNPSSLSSLPLSIERVYSSASMSAGLHGSSFPICIDDYVSMVIMSSPAAQMFFFGTNLSAWRDVLSKLRSSNGDSCSRNWYSTEDAQTGIFAGSFRLARVVSGLSPDTNETFSNC